MAFTLAGELAGRAFQIVRDKHANRSLREIFALETDEDVDARVRPTKVL